MPLLTQTPRRHSNLRLASFHACRRVAQWLGGRRWYRWRFLRPGRLVVRHESMWVPNLPEELDGLQILHLSDLHAGPFLSRGDLAGLLTTVGDRRPDLLVITGDFITDVWQDVLPILGELAQIKPRLGGFAVFGNHDYRGHKDGELTQALETCQVRVLQNEGVQVGELPLWISGLSDLEESGRADVAAARAGMPKDAWELALCHHPGGGPELARPRCVAVLSGHTHGRQMDLPWLRKLGPAHPGLRVKLGSTTLLVHRGLGVVGAPLRVKAPAELLWLTWHRAPDGTREGEGAQFARSETEFSQALASE